MEAKSHDSDDLCTVLINSVETLSKKLDKQDEQIRRLSDALVENTKSADVLTNTVQDSNKIFEQVATGVKSLYDKVTQLEILSKMMGGLGALGPLFGGQPPKKP